MKADKIEKDIKIFYVTAKSFPVYIIFLTANVLSFVAGKDWTIQERFYSGCTVFLCLVIVLFSIRKFRQKTFV